ncbi:MAG: PIN domain-containing protein [Rhodanobacteraceae bacterium]|jgi:PIN domain nuclease of toxin-antitoxin system|nr:PIN domain-containing protein [Rhodanobacteraceae bacterium]
MATVMLDTHIAVALYQGKTGGFGRQALAAIDRDPLCYSPAVLLELELLHEIGRLKHGAAVIARYLADELEIACAGERFVEIVQQALPLAYTRDPFDRLIVAHAELLRAPLITLDQNLRRNYSRAI